MKGKKRKGINPIRKIVQSEMIYSRLILKLSLDS